MSTEVFPRLATLEALVAKTRRSLWQALSEVAVVSCQHLLETTGSLFECLVRKGLRPEYTFILGKVYSTNPEVAVGLRGMGCHVRSGSAPKTRGLHDGSAKADAAELWREVQRTVRQASVRGIIVLDDGAHLGRILDPLVDRYRAVSGIMGVEQTTSGMPLWSARYPVVNVASSAVKRRFEPQFVCEAVWSRVGDQFRESEARVKAGVLGLGKIGVALVGLLREKNLRVYGYDIDPRRSRCLDRGECCRSVSELVEKSDVVFGCTGSDSVPVGALRDAEGCKTFASCSSGDVEFRALLLDPSIPWSALPGGANSCPALEAREPERQLTIRMMRSGYPVNFDNTKESIPRENIQMTRGLLLGAVLQAVDLLGEEENCQAGTVMLDPGIQKTVVEAWQDDTGKRCDVGAEWYSEESRGSAVPCRVLRR